MSEHKILSRRTFGRSATFAMGEDNLLRQIEILLDPLALALSIFGVNFYFQSEVSSSAFILSVLVFAVAFPGRHHLGESLWRCALDILGFYGVILALVLCLGYVTRAVELFPTLSILHWLWLAPLTQLTAHLVFRALAPHVIQWQGGKRKAVIVGMNEQGTLLAERLPENPYNDIELVGYFDDRTQARLADGYHKWPCLGAVRDVSDFCNRASRIDLIYIALPMSSRPRILSLLDELRDTTASIYFVPDTFVTDLIQGRISQICDLPVISACETPFTGFNALIKRVSDIVLSLLILLLVSPLFLLMALGVKATSPGPVFFRQRRYGLSGEEIVVYKFRSMTVCEDGEIIRQAQKGDQRITALGAFLRRTSLDELPQFINVLQGRMSIVGPRPHAVAHNEFYRKRIKGYMVRHKVRPGITGWAQVNGLRGETESLEKMQARIDYDLDYLRRWSFGLDLQIILMTLSVMCKDPNAY
jgi:putative colanic acid biosynthesis UDP-glucose lipid carrier transferase